MTLTQTYQKVRDAGIACVVGESAKISLQIARTLKQWESLESAGFVHIELEPEDSPDVSYLDTWEHISERSKQNIIEEIESKGIYGVIGSFRLSDKSPWQRADSVWNCQGYTNAADPFENAYVADIMAATIDALKDALRGRFCRKCGAKSA